MIIPMYNGFVDGTNKFDFASGAVVALVSIFVVFMILLIVITVTHFLFEGIDAASKKMKERKQKEEPVAIEKVRQPVVIADDDAMAAVLVATIDYQNEIKKGVRVVSIKEIK